MTEPNRAERPRQVTWGASLAVLASALLVVSAYDAMTRLHSVDTRDKLTSALSSSSVRGLGVTLDEATTALHGALLVAGAGAAVAAVLSAFALLGHAAARRALSVVAVVVLLASAPVDPLLGLSLAVAVLLLWTRPARAWFAGAVGSDTEDQERPAQEQPPPPIAPRPQSSPPPHPMPYGAPAPPPSYGAPPTHPPSAYPPPYGAPAHPPPRPPGAPGVVRAAAVVTWVFAGLTALAFLATGLVLAADRGRLLDRVMRTQEFQDLSITRAQLLATLWVMTAAFLVWALVACALAIFVWRGHEWARILLAMSAGGAALVCLLAIPVSLLHLAACAVVVGLLFSSSANAWFRRGRPVPPRGPSGKPPVW